MVSVNVYNEEQARTEGRRQELMRQYFDKPFNERCQSTDVEGELDQVEQWMLDNPPMYQAGPDTFVPRARGLLDPTSHDEAEAEVIPRLADSDFETIEQRYWSDHIGGEDGVTLRPKAGWIMDQNGRGSCAGEGAWNAGEICSRIADPKGGWPKGNPIFMYRVTSGGRDQGSSLISNVNFLKEHGCASNAVWPRDSRNWLKRPSEEAIEDAKRYRLLKVMRVENWTEFGSCLLLGIPVYFGYPGHAICAVQLLSTTRFVYENSWGNWGDKGFGTLANSRIEWKYRAYAFLEVTKPTPLQTAA